MPDPSSQLKPADDLHLIPDGDAVILYAPLTGGVALVNVSAATIVDEWRRGHGDGRRLKDDLIESLASGGVLVDSRDAAPDPPRSSPDGFVPAGVTLFLTTSCSMRCVYCYARGGEDPRTMSREIAEGAIDWIIESGRRHSLETLFFSFHGGGEATLAWDLMVGCVDYAHAKCREAGMQPTFGGGLNGVLADERLDWVAENLNDLTISLDGLPDVQDRQRPLASGGPSFECVDRTLRRLDEAGVRYGIRSTVTRESLPALVESTVFIARRYRTPVIHLEPVYAVGRADADMEVDPEEFVAAFRAARPLARVHGVELKYSGARLETLTDCFCQAVGAGSFSVTPDGLVTSCYEVMSPEDPRTEDFFYGRWDLHAGGFVLDLEKIESLRHFTVHDKEGCRDCFCRWHCAGDCPAKLALLGSARDQTDKARCHIARELTKDQLKERLYQEPPDEVS